MRKIFLICIVCFFISGESHANWYGNHSVSYANPGSISLPTLNGGGPNRGTQCDNDGDNTGGGHSTLGHFAAANNNSSTTLTPEAGSYSMPLSGPMRCLYWDGQPPQDLTLTYTTGWTNTSRVISVSARDTGGSRLKRVLLQESVNGGAWSSVVGGDWDNLSNPNDTLVTRTWTRTPVDGSSFRYRIYAYDYAGNSSTYTNPGIIQFDTTPPSIVDVSNTNPENFLANNAQSYFITVSNNGGSPIVQVDHQKENAGDNSLGSVVSDTSSPWSYNWNISRVDNYRLSNGSRQYTFRLRRICDEAGNCWIGSQDYNHNVYSNTLSIDETITQNQIISGIADGTQRNFAFILTDQYGNAIIPASGIGRTVDINVRGNNALRLNQYNNNGTDSGIFIETPSISFPVSPTALRSMNNRSSTNGSYSLPFYIFAPTNNVDPLVPGSVSLSIDYDINRTTAILTGDNPQSQSLLASTSLRYDSLYKTSISGELATQGFIEGGQQNSTIASLKTSGGANITSGTDDIRLEFGEYSSGQNNPNSRYDISINSTPLIEGNQSSWTNITNIFNFGNNTANSFLFQSGPVLNLTSSYLASIIKYQIAGKTVVYPSDIIGKGSYFGGTTEQNTTQQGIKILGQTSSDKNQELVIDQFTDDVRIIGKLTKSSHKRDISKKTFDLIRSVTPDNGSNRVTNFGNTNRWNTQAPASGKKLLSDSVLYFGDMTGEYVEIGNGSSQIISGNKTLVIVGGDAYITSNLTNGNSSSILGIIVLSDSEGNGGNVYIDPDVTDISAVIYTDKAIMSATDYNSNGTIEFGTSEIHSSSTPISTLANQLYIYGSVFSENTIGGSRSSPIQCPYYVSSCSSIAQAQPYDLNYMRRYAMIDDDNNPVTPLVIANGGSASAGASSYPSYPMVIEYNSSIQSNPPALFK